MADPNKFPWQVQDNDALAKSLGIDNPDSLSGWASIVDADGMTIGAVYMLSRAENLEWAQKIVDLVNEACARPSDGSAAKIDGLLYGTGFEKVTVSEDGATIHRERIDPRDVFVPSEAEIPDTDHA